MEAEAETEAGAGAGWEAIAFDPQPTRSIPPRSTPLLTPPAASPLYICRTHNRQSPPEEYEEYQQYNPPGTLGLYDEDHEEVRLGASGWECCRLGGKDLSLYLAPRFYKALLETHTPSYAIRFRWG